MTALKLTTIGTSTGAVIPKEMLARLKVGKGDTLYAIETAGGYLITPYDPAIEEQLKPGGWCFSSHEPCASSLQIQHTGLVAQAAS